MIREGLVLVFKGSDQKGQLGVLQFQSALRFQGYWTFKRVLTISKDTGRFKGYWTF